MEHTLLKRWKQLEDALLLIVDLLLKHKPFILPLDQDLILRRPQTYGYMRGHTTRRHARWCAMQSRAAFLSMVAVVGFLFARLGGVKERNPPWIDVLKRDEQMDAVWLESLAQSSAGDFSSSNPRVGLVVDSNDAMMRGWFPIYVQAGIPVWIIWRTEIDCKTGLRTATYGHWGEWLPEESLVEAALRSSTKPQLDVSHSKHSSGQEVGMNFTRQLDGEGWREYFERQGEMERRISRNESMDAKKTRRNKTRERWRKPDNALVFRWVHEDGRWTRVNIPRQYVRDFWPANRDDLYYNAIYDQWDILTEIHQKKGERDTVDTCNDGDDAGIISEYARDAEEDQGNTDEISQNVIARDLEHFSYRSYESSTLARVEEEDAETLFYYRFGLVCSGDISSTMAGQYVWCEERHPAEWHRATVALMHHSAIPVSRRIQNMAVTVVKGLRGYSKEPEQALVSDNKALQFWDLNQHCVDHISRTVHSFDVQKIMAEGRTYWRIIRRQGDWDLDWELLICDAASVLEAQRRGMGPAVIDLVTSLVDRGMRFHTVVTPGFHHPSRWVLTREKHTAQQVLSGHLLGIGLEGPRERRAVRLPLQEGQTTFSLDDYRLYECLRDELLQKPHARAAVMRGGIVWRLSCAVVPVGAVLNGPSHEVYAYSHPLKSQFNLLLWDDELATDEEELICGNYTLAGGSDMIPVIMPN